MRTGTRMVEVVSGLGASADVLFRLLHARYVGVVEGLHLIVVGVGDLEGGIGDVAERAQGLAAILRRSTCKKVPVRYLARRFSILRACFSIFADDCARLVGAKAMDAKAMATSKHELRRRKWRILFIGPLKKSANIGREAISTAAIACRRFHNSIN